MKNLFDILLIIMVTTNTGNAALLLAKGEIETTILSLLVTVIVSGLIWGVYKADKPANQ